MDGWHLLPLRGTEATGRRSTWLSALAGGLLMGGGEQEEGCQPSGYTEEVPSVWLVFMV